MANPVMQMLSQASGSQAANPAVEMYRMYKAAKNPQAALNQMISQNPQLAQIQQLKANGTNMQQAFYALCQQQGVDPQTILSQFN